MAVTPFLKLQKPPFDTIPWDEAVNGNMDTIDAFISRYMAVPNYVGAWVNSTNYISGQNVLDITNATIYLCQVTHVSSALPTTFVQDRTTYPTYWAATTNVVSGSNVALTIAEITPLTAKAGDLWWNSAEGQLYILYNDGNSLQWVVANNQSGNIGDAPRDGNVYGRQMGAWVGSVNSQDVGRNKLHNGLFTVAQRGVGPWTVSGYTADRWSAAIVTDAASFSIITLADADRTGIGDEEANSAMQNVFTGNAAAGAFHQFVHKIENVRRFGGKTITVSFWAKAATGTPKIGINFVQHFGTGGSPSTAVRVLATGNAVTLSTSWARYTSTIATPSISGKTLGTAGDHSSWLELWYSSGATNNAIAGNIGVQSGTIQLWGVQLEIAAPGQTQPSPLEKKDPRMELSDCQRFYQVGQVIYNAYQAASTGLFMTLGLPTTMRANPTVVPTNVAGGNMTGLSAGPEPGGSAIYVSGVATATGATQISCSFTASADL